DGSPSSMVNVALGILLISLWIEKVLIPTSDGISSNPLDSFSTLIIKVDLSGSSEVRSDFFIVRLLQRGKINRLADWNISKAQQIIGLGHIQIILLVFIDFIDH